MKKITYAVLAALALSISTTAEAATQAFATQAKVDFMRGNFQVPASACTAAGTPSTCCTGNGAGATCPTYKLALVANASNAGASSTTFAGVTSEVTGTGYTAGGATLTGYAVSGTCITFTSPVTWGTATITARAAVLYCSANCPALDVIGTYCLDGSSCAADTSSTGGTFTVNLPAGGMFCVN